MARSSTIWLVTKGPHSIPAAAFTVKHEMITWLSRLGANAGSYFVTRIPDGDGEPGDTVSAKEFLN